MPFFNDRLKFLLSECEKKGLGLRLGYLSGQDLSILQDNYRSKKLVCCQVIDQYKKRIGNSFAVFLGDELLQDEVEIILKEKIKQLRIQHCVRKNKTPVKKAGAGEIDLEFEDEESTFSSEKPSRHSNIYMTLQEEAVDNATMMQMDF